MVKDPVAPAYYQFTPSEWDLISLFDGRHTDEDVANEYNQKHPLQAIGEEDLQAFKENLKNLELVILPSMEKNLMLLERIRTQRKTRVERASWTGIAEINLWSFDPNAQLDRLMPYIRWIWTKPFFIASMACILLMLIIDIVKWDELWQGTIQLYSFRQKTLWQILVFIFFFFTTGALHELGHGLTLKHFGGEIHQMGFCLFYFSPSFWVDISDGYLIPRKQSMWVTFSGVYTELMLCSFAAFVWVLAVPGSLAYEFSLQLFLICNISSFFLNMNPLIKLDGYHALVDILGISELREQSFAFLERWIKVKIFRLRVEEEEPPTRRKRRIFVIYGVLSILYTVSIYVVFLIWIRNIYLESFRASGYILFLLTLYFFFRKELRQAFGFLRYIELDKKEVLMKKKKNVYIGLGAAALFLLIPWSNEKISSPFVIEPVRRADVRCETEGFVDEVTVKETSAVQAGQTLAKLRNPELNRQFLELQSRLDLLTRELSQLSSSLQTAEYEMKRREEEQVIQETNEVHRKMQNLSLKAPIRGTVITPAVHEKVGTFLTKGMLLCEVADLSRVKIELPVPDYDIEHARTGQTVILKLDAYPSETFEGRVSEISAATVERVESLGGTFAKLRVTAVIDNAERRLVPGMRGDAKILAGRHSIVGRILRELGRWVTSKVW